MNNMAMSYELSSSEFNLSLEDQERIRVNLTKMYEYGDDARLHVNKETQNEIRLAANCGVKELFDLACLATMAIVTPHYAKLAITKYQDPPRTTVEDLINAPLYEAIRDSIKNYNAEYALTTYLEGFVTAAFKRARAQGSGETLTRHYTDMKAIIGRAERELEGEGYSSLSDADLSCWIEKKYGRKISETTIKRVHEMERSEVSLGKIEGGIKTGSAENPEMAILEKEHKEEFRDNIKALPPIHQKCLQAVLDYVTETGEVPTTSTQMQEVCRAFMGEISKNAAAKLVNATFAKYKSFHRRYREEAQDEGNSHIAQDVQVMEKEEYELQNYKEKEKLYFFEDVFEEAVFADEL